MDRDLLDFKPVPFESLYFDPNNPRLAPTNPPGYENPDHLFDSKIQQQLFDKIPTIYPPDDLRSAVEHQGWVPIDAIVVWEHPKRRGHYVVLEGNTRTYVLKMVRVDLEKAHQKLKKLKGAKTGVTKTDIERQQRLVARLEQIKNDTDSITVAPVNAKSIEELERRLPRLLGVRHIQPAKGWSPYAKNRYISALYQQEFEKRFPKKALRLDDELIDDVAARVSQKSLETRRNIQAALAFTHFRLEYEDQVPKGKGEGLKDEDQYFFENILKNAYARDQFRFDSQALKLEDDMEDVLFKWAFAQPRNGKENLNVLEIAEDFRLWHQVAMYDDKKGTRFAKRLDVKDPDSAERIREVEIDYSLHKQRMSGVSLLTRLVGEFGELKAEALKEQASHFKPLLEQVVQLGNDFLKMIDAVDAPAATGAHSTTSSTHP